MLPTIPHAAANEDVWFDFFKDYVIATDKEQQKLLKTMGPNMRERFDRLLETEKGRELTAPDPAMDIMLSRVLRTLQKQQEDQRQLLRMHRLIFAGVLILILLSL